MEDSVVGMIQESTNVNSSKLWLAMDILRIENVSAELQNEAEKVILAYLKEDK